MPLENERYPYWPLPARPPIRWPNDARIAVWVIPNVEHFRFGLPVAGAPGPTPHLPEFAARDYGARVGVWRMMDVLDKHSIRATVALNADVCRFYPQIIEAGQARGWEWMGHGVTNSEALPGMTPDQEIRTIRETIRGIAEATGGAPRGWLGPGMRETEVTPDLLAECGIEYTGDWIADDQPFQIRVRSGRLLSIPYSRELNDIPAYARMGLTPEQFAQMIKDQFDVLYEEGEQSGRVMAIALHPYLSGHPFRSKWLDHALGYIARHERVWWATGSEIADWYFGLGARG